MIDARQFYYNISDKKSDIFTDIFTDIKNDYNIELDKIIQCNIIKIIKSNKQNGITKDELYNIINKDVIKIIGIDIDKDVYDKNIEILINKDLIKSNNELLYYIE